MQDFGRSHDLWGKEGISRRILLTFGKKNPIDSHSEDTCKLNVLDFCSEESPSSTTRFSS